jgi:hypothetical protein
MSIWDDPDLKPAGNYVTFETPGDQIVGTILAIRKHTFPDGKVAPELIIRKDDGEECTLTAGQVVLSRRLSELRPSEGDRLAVVFTNVEKRDGGKTLKHFDVQVANANPAAVAAQPQPAPTAQSLV